MSEFKSFRAIFSENLTAFSALSMEPTKKTVSKWYHRYYSGSAIPSCKSVYPLFGYLFAALCFVNQQYNEQNNKERSTDLMYDRQSNNTMNVHKNDAADQRNAIENSHNNLESRKLPSFLRYDGVHNQKCQSNDRHNNVRCHAGHSK